MVPGAVRRGCPSAARPQELRARAVDARGLRTAATALAIGLLRRGEALRIRARGASMLPFVRDRDILDVDPPAAACVRRGDLVCYESEPGALKIHRVVACHPDRVFVRGDARSHGEWVSRADVLGGVVALERRGRRRPYPGGAVRRRLPLCLAPLLAPLVDRALRLRGAWRRAR